MIGDVATPLHTTPFAGATPLRHCRRHGLLLILRRYAIDDAMLMDGA